MSKSDLLLIGALVFPFLMMLAAVWPRLRAWLFALLPLAPLPALAAALLVPEGSLVLAPAPLRLTLQLDAPNAMLLAGAALLWAAAGFYARGYMAGATHRGSFALWWLLTMGGSFGICVVGDMTSFYLVFAIASLSAYGLVAHEDTAAAHRAASIYMALAMLGEAFLLLAFVMLAAGSGHGNLPIGEAVAHLPASLWRTPIIVLLTLGFGLKMGLVPLHAWMPLAHPVAPMPASAVLSGVIVNAGVIGLIRFLPLDVALPGAGAALMALGFFTAFYAVAVGLAQRHPKVVLA
jgi:formate hydrogenlyase subunit 3/multisubunit Na+/H+ antiporter MnhD subunit